MSEDTKVGYGQCQAHNPNKCWYEIWKTNEGFFCETDHMISGPYISTPIFPTQQEAEAEYRRRAMR